MHPNASSSSSSIRVASAYQRSSHHPHPHPHRHQYFQPNPFLEHEHHPSQSSSYPYNNSNTTNTSNHYHNKNNNNNNIFTILYQLFVISLSTLCLTGLCTTLLLLYLTIRPFSIPTYRRLASHIGAAAFYDAIAVLLPNMKIHLTGDSDIPSPVGISVLVCNRVMDGDWWAMLMLARCVGLRGSVKAFLPTDGTSSSSSTSKQQDGTNNDGNSPLLATGGGGGDPSFHGSVSAPSLSQQLLLQQQQQNNSPLKGSKSQPFILLPSTTTTTTAHSQSSTTTYPTSTTHHSNQPTTTSTTNSTNYNTSSSSSSSSSTFNPISFGKHFLHKFLEFPYLYSETNKDYIQDRDQLFTLLRSFADQNAPAPVHLLLYPEGLWRTGMMNNNYDSSSSSVSCSWEQDHKFMIAKSMEFAKREGRPLLKHLLLPKTTGFYASLDSLRLANPVIYDVTMAYKGYHDDGFLAPPTTTTSTTTAAGSLSLSSPLPSISTTTGGSGGSSASSWITTILAIIKGQIPNEVHIRIKRYSMEEVLQDPQWLDKKWAEKDRLLHSFARQQSFPSDNRGFCKHRILDTKTYSVESSITALLRLGLIPFAIPVIVLLFVPILWIVMWLWIMHRTFMTLFPSTNDADIVGRRIVSGASGLMNSKTGDSNSAGGGSDSAVLTPFFPATPFVSPTHATWISSSSTATGASAVDSSESPIRRL